MNLSVEKFASSPILLAMFVRKNANAKKLTGIYSRKNMTYWVHCEVKFSVPLIIIPTNDLISLFKQFYNIRQTIYEFLSVMGLHQRCIEEIT